MHTLKFVAIGIAIGLFFGYFLFHSEDPNAERVYGPSGLPSNCRALIYELEADYYLHEEYTHEELLMSLFRNCGETGHLWDR
jgi:hypothetical protein